MHRFPKLSNPFILAPMAGVNDAAFRLLCKEYGASLVYSEMVSADSIIRSNKAALHLLESCKQEKPVSVQIFGHDADTLAKAARYIEKDHDFDMIDINLGCPATKIMNNDAGASLLKNPEKIAEIVSKVCSAVDLPVSVKMRIGIDARHINALEIARIAEDNGADAIAVHARTANQGYGGKSDWSWIKKVKESVNIPVIGNGDIAGPESALKMIKETGCDYVMIGRSAMGNPYIFRQCNNFLDNGRYETEDRKISFFRYLEYSKRFTIRFQAIKQSANYFSKGIVGGARIREKIAHCRDIEELKALF